MTDQPVPEVAKPSPVQQLTPDWQQIALLLLWKLLPTTDKTITITPQDFEDVMTAYPGGPVILFRPTPESTLVGLATMDEAIALAASYNQQLAETAEKQNAPATARLQ